jgi:hypothetical protein
MPLPESRHATYQDGSTPSPDEDYFNDTQDCIIDFDRFFHGPSLAEKDDFLGSAICTGRWIVTGAGITVVSDAAAGGYGAARLAGTSGDATQELESRDLPIGTGDFRIRVRARYSTLNSNGSFTIGLPAPGASAYFFSSSAALSGRWGFVYGGVPTTADTGVSPSSSYQTFDINRESGIVTAKIDGVEVFQDTMSDSIGTGVLTISAVRGSADLTLLCDYVSITAATSR